MYYNGLRKSIPGFQTPFTLLPSVVCFTAVIALAALANLASTALTNTIQKDWIVSLTGDNRGQLAGELWI